MSVIPAFASLTLPSATANVVPLQELQLPLLQFPTLAVPSQPSKKAAPAPIGNRVASPASAPVAGTLPSTQSTTSAPVEVVDNTYRLVPAPKRAPAPAADPFAKVPVVVELVAPTGVLPEPVASAPPSTEAPAATPAAPAAPAYEPEAPAVTPPVEEAPPVRMLASAAAAEEETPTSPAEEPAAPAEPEASSSEPVDTVAGDHLVERHVDRADDVHHHRLEHVRAAGRNDVSCDFDDWRTTARGQRRLGRLRIGRADDDRHGSRRDRERRRCRVDDHRRDRQRPRRGLHRRNRGAAHAGAGCEGHDRRCDDADRGRPGRRNAHLCEQRPGR